jgi:predicted enzyme related to lactoylglutathione lyase
MFDPRAAYSSFAVNDIEAAKRFYGGTLGLDTKVMYDGQMLEVGLGERQLMIYPKPDFKPATYTVLNFPVPDVEKAVDELTAKGIEMATFDGFKQDAKGISRDNGGPTIAWFRDPAGNILAVHDQTPPPS